MSDLPVKADPLILNFDPDSTHAYKILLRALNEGNKPSQLTDKDIEGLLAVDKEYRKWGIIGAFTGLACCILLNKKILVPRLAGKSRNNRLMVKFPLFYLMMVSNQVMLQNHLLSPNDYYKLKIYSKLKKDIGDK